MAKKSAAKQEATDEKVVSQGIYKTDSDNLKLLGQLSGDQSIAATIRRCFRADLQAAVTEAMDRKVSHAELLRTAGNS